MNDLEIILEKCKSPFLEQLEILCYDFKLIGMPNESPKWLQFAGVEGTDIIFKSSQKSNFGFMLHGANFLEPSEIETLMYWDYLEPYNYFKTLKYSHLSNFHPTIK